MKLLTCLENNSSIQRTCSCTQSPVSDFYPTSNIYTSIVLLTWLCLRVSSSRQQQRPYTVLCQTMWSHSLALISTTAASVCRHQTQPMWPRQSGSGTSVNRWLHKQKLLLANQQLMTSDTVFVDEFLYLFMFTYSYLFYFYVSSWQACCLRCYLTTKVEIVFSLIPPWSSWL